MLLFSALFTPALVSGEWRADTPGAVTAQNGLCARIPCHYRYPSELNSKPRTGIWFNSELHDNKGPVAFHSGNHSLASTKFQHRTRLSGILKDNDCSLVIDNVTQQDAGPYLFRVEFKGSNDYSYRPATQLSVTDFTDKPTIFAAELVAGKPVNMTCSFNTTCDGTAPTLTWVWILMYRDMNILDLLYANDKEAYSSIARLPRGISDHNMVHLLSRYKPMIQRLPVSTSSIKFCVDNASEETVHCFPNNKSRVTSDINALLNQKKRVFRNGDRKEVKQAQKDLKARLRQGKDD
ncbi:myelin-associated glycoprotein-like [Amblyraja radiata]|uniref:myelin-associated glycoprotein-like n=1 Tax=Amblyraja radiata TaxID=386614 RepID=UPI001403551D|nr:myelin-associated glycoprotein-like [Amblyraja radiata]